VRIVVLDGYALNPGDLSWAPLARFGEVAVHDRTPPDLILERSRGADVLFTNKTPLSAATLAALPQVRYVGVLATGYNVVNVAAAHDCGVVVTNVPTYGTHSVVQMVFALLFELCRSVREHSEAARSGEWSRQADFCYWRTPQLELTGKTMGLVGFGRIGQCVARAADAFGMSVRAYDVVRPDPPPLTDFAWLSIPELLRESDVVSLHCPLTPDTEGLIDRETLALMKATAFLINTARGPIVVEDDLAHALNAGEIAGAGLDVMRSEPPSADNPLLSAQHCVVTPHIAWATFEARSRLMSTAVSSLEAFLAGRPINVVSAAV